MFRIPVRKSILSLILSTLFIPSFAASPLEEYVDMTILEESNSQTITPKEQTIKTTIKTLLDLDHYTRHTELIGMKEALEKGAEANNPDDTFLLGYYYYSEAEDNEKLEDFTKARTYFLKAESLGSEDASYLLGDTYYYGEGVDQDYQKAAEYYGKASNQADALFSLGSLYMGGYGVKEDAKKGISLYQKAADLNHSTAQFTLGYIYESGDYDAVKPDQDLALSWYQLACDNADTRSCDAAKRLAIQSKSFPEIFAEIKQDPAISTESTTHSIPNLTDLSRLEDTEKLNILHDHLGSIILETEANNANATYLLGLYYQLKGDNYYDEYAYSQAKAIFEKAAELGVSDALFSLGELYYYGNGVTQNFEKSLAYYTDPALSNHPEAIFSIGVQYDSGEGVEQSYEKSFEYFHKASALNHNPSTFNIGYMYEMGEFVPKDLEQAQKWYQKSCDNQYEAGCNAVDLVLNIDAAAEASSYNENTQNYQLQQIFDEVMGTENSETPLTLTPESVLSADMDAARTFLNQSSHQLLENIKTDNDADSLFLMGYLFFLEGLETDSEKLFTQAYALFERAAAENSEEAYFYLGKLLYEGTGTSQDFTSAYQYLDKLKESDNSEALFYLASMYDEGLGVDKDQAQSFELYKRAADLGHVSSAFNLGFMYEHGEYVDVDLAKAQHWYGNSCLLGDSEACDQVAYIDALLNDEAAVEAQDINEIERGIRTLFDDILNMFSPD